MGERESLLFICSPSFSFNEFLPSLFMFLVSALSGNPRLPPKIQSYFISTTTSFQKCQNTLWPHVAKPLEYRPLGLWGISWHATSTEGLADDWGDNKLHTRANMAAQSCNIRKKNIYKERSYTTGNRLSIWIIRGVNCHYLETREERQLQCLFACLASVSARVGLKPEDHVITKSWLSDEIIDVCFLFCFFCS